MARQQQHFAHAAHTSGKTIDLKRKEHPSKPKSKSNKRVKLDHRSKQRDARVLAMQTSSEAFKHGELDVDKFVQARQHEIRAMEDGMSRSKRALTQRAFQQVPKELRRRTASHNPKKVPKRLQQRAMREMVDDNTPAVTAKRKRPTRHMRLRIETAKRLRALGAKRKATKADATGVENAEAKTTEVGDTSKPDEPETAVAPRPAKIKQASLAVPPVVKTKFRKRQINKTWLPTHMFHAKRARMTLPKNPLWGYAMPLTPTVKSYRPTHRAANKAGAIAWDASYMSTISLAGQQRSIETVLKGVGVNACADVNVSKTKRDKWTGGTRVWEGFLFQRGSPHLPIGPASIIWCARSRFEHRQEPSDGDVDEEESRRQVFVRIHPSAFFKLWEELLPLSKVAKPRVSIKDLRYEIGSIELTGPAATEALQAALWPTVLASNPAQVADAASQTWISLRGLPCQSMLPSNILLGFDAQDPRLHFPPRKFNQTRDDIVPDERFLEILATWPLDTQQEAPKLFDTVARQLASSRLPSQKSINRRKGLAAPGEYPAVAPQDPRIPVLLFNTCSGGVRNTTWTLLLPWKCVQPVWYSIMYCPLFLGGQPRFGGLDERRQLLFEKGSPWFPGDYPGTTAGWQWEQEQRRVREDAWKRRPKSKRVNWDTVRCAEGQQGELGLGFACHWEKLVAGVQHGVGGQPAAVGDVAETQGNSEALSSNEDIPPVLHVTVQRANAILQQSGDLLPDNALATVRIRLLHRGVPQTCARIYRLPSITTSLRLRKRWLDLHPDATAARKRNGPKHAPVQVSKDTPAHIARQRLAASLLEPPRVGDSDYPICPGEEDLIGFVTTGDYNLGEGQGMAIGCILLSRVKGAVVAHAREGRLCVVRNTGEGIGRLAAWEIV